MLQQLPDNTLAYLNSIVKSSGTMGGEDGPNAMTNFSWFALSWNSWIEGPVQLKNEIIPEKEKC